MNRGELTDALTALAAELERRGVSTEMYVVGGAAIALAFDERRSTRDRQGLPRGRGSRRVAGARPADEILAIAEQTYGDRLDPAARFFVEQVFEAS